MGCVQSTKNLEKSDSSHDTISTNSEIIVPTKTRENIHISLQASLQSTSQPLSQSYELSAKPINPSTPSTSDEEELISEYITATVNWRNQHGGDVNLEKQLKNKRPELICVGAFIQSNESWDQYEILYIDSKLPRSGAPYRPDLIVRSKDTNSIIHVEIDEYAHRSYNADKERIRREFIDDYFSNEKYQCFHFNPNVYNNPIKMANSFVQLMRGAEGLIYAHGHN